MIKSSQQLKTQCGTEQSDYVGDFFAEVMEKFRGQPVYCQSYMMEQSLNRVSMMIVDNQMVASVIERRTEFNDLEFTFWRID